MDRADELISGYDEPNRNAVGKRKSTVTMYVQSGRQTQALKQGHCSRIGQGMRGATNEVQRGVWRLG